VLFTSETMEAISKEHARFFKYWKKRTVNQESCIQEKYSSEIKKGDQGILRWRKTKNLLPIQLPWKSNWRKFSNLKKNDNRQNLKTSVKRVWWEKHR
jgi:hypothetical protein